MEDNTFLLTSLLPSLEFAFDIPKDWLCSRCEHVALRPWRAKCQHLLCWRCLNEVLHGLQKCPIDGSDVNIGEATLESEIDQNVRKMHVKCPYQKHGCGKVMALANVKDHVNMCEFIPVYCPKECGLTISRKDLVQHLAAACPGAPAVPLYKPTSSWQVRDSMLNGKFSQSESRVDRLPIDEKAFTSLQCQLEQLSRALSHCFWDNVRDHNVRKLSHINGFEKSDRDILENNLNNEANISTEKLGHSKMLDILEETLGTTRILLQRVNHLEEKMMTKEMADKNTAAVMERTDAIQSTLKFHYKKLEQLEIFQQKVDEKWERIQKRLQEIKTMFIEETKDLEDLADGLEEQRRALITVMGTRTPRELTTSSGGNGKFLWKIEQYAVKKQMAIKGVEPELCSPPFYTHSFGYKLCMRAYPNGYGDGEGTHLSVYICLMRGPYDDTLPWPFRHKFTFYLLDQKNREKKDDLQQTVDPKKMASNYTKWNQKPVTERNVGFGLPEFIKHDKLEKKSNYLQNDTIFLKLVIDTSDLDK